MAFPVGSRTLAEVRKAVALRCNFGSQPQKIKTVQPILDQYIGDSHVLLAGMADWLDSIRKVNIPFNLVTSQQNYDFPDDCLPGNIAHVTCVDLNGYEHEIFPGMRSNERNASIAVKSQPLRYEIQNGEMVLWPIPDTTTWRSMNIYYNATPINPMDDQDVIVVDFNALVRHATRACRGHFKMAQESEQDLNDFLENVIAQQSDGEVFHFGGRTSFKTDHKKQNRISRNGFAVSGPGWQPF